MKKLSDYKDDEALILWGDLLEPMSKIAKDEAVQAIYAEFREKKQPITSLASGILKAHPTEVRAILERIDNEDSINGVTALIRFTAILTDIASTPNLMDDIKSFFQFAGKNQMNKSEISDESIG